MGFGDFLKRMGNSLAEMDDERKVYTSMYQAMSDNDLLNERISLINSRPSKARTLQLMAVISVLNDRGYRFSE